MRIHMHMDHLSQEEKEQLEAQLQKKMTRFRRLLDSHHPAEDEVKMDLHLRRFEKKQSFECRMVVELPRVHQSLVAEDSKSTILEGLDSVAAKMETQLTKHFKKLVRE